MVHAASTTSQFGEQLWHRNEEVVDKTVVRYLEDGTIFIFVDRYDDFAVLHSALMLNGATDPNLYNKIERCEEYRLYFLKNKRGGKTRGVAFL